jgi:hypothetical protein
MVEKLFSVEGLCEFTFLIWPRCISIVPAPLRHVCFFLGGGRMLVPLFYGKGVLYGHHSTEIIP